MNCINCCDYLIYLNYFLLSYKCSLAGLGKDKSVACVSVIAVEKNLVTKYSVELRIETWQYNCREVLGR